MYKGKFKGYKIECEECCELYFWEDETLVEYNSPEDGFVTIPFRDWKNLKFKDIFGTNSGSPRVAELHFWVKCPECGKLLPVWKRSLKTVGVGNDSPVGCLSTIKEWEDIGYLSVGPKQKMTTYGTKTVYSNELEFVWPEAFLEGQRQFYKKYYGCCSKKDKEDEE